MKTFSLGQEKTLLYLNHRSNSKVSLHCGVSWYFIKLFLIPLQSLPLLQFFRFSIRYIPDQHEKLALCVYKKACCPPSPNNAGKRLQTACVCRMKILVVSTGILRDPFAWIPFLKPWLVLNVTSCRSDSRYLPVRIPQKHKIQVQLLTPNLYYKYMCIYNIYLLGYKPHAISCPEKRLNNRVSLTQSPQYIAGF